MAFLADVYTVDRHYRRAKRLDADLDVDGIEGYRLTNTVWRTLKQLTGDIAATNQRAFTWTGPYGSGKSSLALVLAGLLSPQGPLRSCAEHILEQRRLAEFRESVPCSSRGWVVVRVVGRRECPIQAIAAALSEACRNRWGHEVRNASSVADVSSLISSIKSTMAKADAEGDGLLIIVDEMGKFLEHAAIGNGDIHIFQELAEVLSRQKSRGVVLGILHQAFDEYARRGSKTARAEWAKIQGRFADTPFSIAVEEVVGLIAGAIDGPKTKWTAALAERVAAALAGTRLGGSRTLPAALAACAPLHPTVALLLGPVSRRRFGQNERSVFTFLCSHEPCGFGDFLDTEEAGSNRLYTPSDLWDYLDLNYGPSILSSPDGGRWAEAAEAVDRAQRGAGSTEKHAAMAKTIALLDIVGRPTGISATDQLLAQTFGDGLPITDLLEDLRKWSVVVQRRHAGGWGIFAGSDIDVESEAEALTARLREDLPTILAHVAEPSPILAKRHYAERGTMRVFLRRIVPVSSLRKVLADEPSGGGVVGQFVLVIGDKPDSPEEGAAVADDASMTLMAFIPEGHELLDAAARHAALELLPSLHPGLNGDAAARRELAGRQAAARTDLDEAMRAAFTRSRWSSPHLSAPRLMGPGGLSELASEVCDRAFKEAPIIVNELLNRDRPSSAAAAARRRLMHAMALKMGTLRLGIEGEPAELGLYLSLLAVSGIHGPSDGSGKRWSFRDPREQSFQPMWQAALDLLHKNTAAETPTPVSNLFALWSGRPFGIRAGVLPVLALAFALARQDAVALYLDGNFVAEIDDLLVDRLLQSPDMVGVRWVGTDKLGARTLKAIASFVERIGLGQGGQTTALDVTKPLVQFAMKLPGWVRRTRQMSAETIRIRDILLEAKDPYILLFKALPVACGIDDEQMLQTDGTPAAPMVTVLGNVIEELKGRQARLLAQLREILSTSLNADLSTPDGRAAVALRAKKVLGAQGALDLRVRRFTQVLSEADKGGDWIESACGIAAGRPIKDWGDPDVGRCGLELSGLCEQFGQAEAYATVQAPGGTPIKSTATTILNNLASSGLDIAQQRAVLLLALKELTENSPGGSGHG
jgi:energy-coupling factor transporter ATP-binding protein EcfA2